MYRSQKLVAEARGNEVRTKDVTLYTCTTCGAVVGPNAAADKSKHDRWRARIEKPR